MKGKTEVALASILLDAGNPTDMRLAALWQLEEKNLNSSIPAGLENELLKSRDTLKTTVQQTIKLHIKEEWEVLPRIQWAAWLLMSTILLHVIFLVLVKNTFGINLFQHSPTVVGLIVRTGILLILGIFMLRGYQWTRIVSLILFVIGAGFITYTYYITFQTSTSLNPYGVLLTGYIVVVILVWSISLYLVFSKEANNWYKGLVSKDEELTMDQM